MALTANQKERLEPYTNIKEAHEVHVTVCAKGDYRRFRAGFGHYITVCIVYPIDGYKDLSRTISFCRFDYTALSKGKEIAKYLADEKGLGRDVVKLKSQL